MNDLARVQALIRDGDPWDRHRPLHVTASALVVEPSSLRVLLRWHKRLGRWLQVGGHGDPGESDPWDIAIREAREETGLEDLHALKASLERTPIQIVIVPVPGKNDEPPHEHVDVRYVLATAQPDKAVAETPDAPLRWLTIADAETEAEEENFRELLRRLEQLLSN